MSDAMLDAPKIAANDRRIAALLLHREVEEFNNAYAAALDEQRLADWAEMFTDDGFYVVISRENADRNRQHDDHEEWMNAMLAHERVSF